MILVKQNIAKFLNDNGIKQVIISQKTGIQPQKISLILRGKRTLDIEEYVQICNALGVPYDYFFDRPA